MRHLICLVLMSSLSLFNFTNAQEHKTSNAKLTWNNDDSLSGSLVSYQDNYIKWQSPQFTDPLEIHSDYIASVDFHDNDPDRKNTDEQFRLQTANGAILLGELVELDTETITLKSKRLGTIEVKRDHIREIRQLKHTAVLYDGPRWLDGWRTLRAGRLVSEWETTDQGHLTTRKYNGELYRDLPKLDLAEINLVLRWTGKPGLQVDFAAPAELVSPGGKAQLSIKSWGSDLVATTSVGGTDFQPLLRLEDRQTELRLRIVWDTKVGEAIITSPNGKVHGRVLIDNKRKSFGVLVKNRSDNLTLEQLRVSKWNGVSKSEGKTNGSYLRLSDGKLMAATASNLSDGQLELTDGTSVPLTDVAIMGFASKSKSDFYEHHVRFFDGTELTGKIDSMDAGQMRVRLPSAKETVTVKREGVHSIHCFQGRTDQFEFHLVGSGNRLSGNLAPVPQTEALGWAPVGSKSPVPISVGTEQTIERRMGKTDGSRPMGTEIVFLRDDSVLFGEVQRIEDNKLIFKTEYTQQQAVPVKEVRATEMLGGSGRVSFTDPGWNFTREARPLQQAQERVEIADPVSMRHRQLKHGGRVSFSCTWDEDFSGLLSVHLGSNTRQPRNSLVRFTFSQNRVSARSLLSTSTSQTLPIFSERRADISIDASNGQAIVWVNGIKVFETPLKRKLEDVGLWLQGGSARSMGNSANRAAKPRLVIDRLRVGDGAGRMGSGFANMKSVEMILKLPRNRTDDWPNCVLCAANGDLLRGELLGVDDRTVSFKARYESVTLPRDEVSALVWLQLPDETKKRPRTDSLLLTLRDGSQIRIKAPKVQGSHLIGKHDLLSACKIPLEMVLRIQNGETNQPSQSNFASWKLEKTPEPKFVEDGAGDGLDSLLIGQSVADVALPMFDDSVLKLGEEQRIVVLDFWASWCAPCIRSLPKLVNLAKQYPNDEVRFIGVNVEENEFTIQGFLSSRGLEMEVAMDLDAAVANKFGVKTIPQTLVIANGKVERHFVGAPADLAQKVDQAVKGLLQPTD